MEIRVGRGENCFTMSRGSFKYKQKISKKRLLTCIGKEAVQGGYVLCYSDEKNGSVYRILFKEESNILSVAWQGECPENVNRFWITLKTDRKEKIYGCGETYSEWNLKGEKVRIWVAEHQNAARISKKIISEKLFGKKPDKKRAFGKYESYYAQPTFVSSNKYFIHADCNTYAEFDFTIPEKTTLYFQEAPKFVVGKADSFPELSKRLSKVLGRQQALPDWIYDGVILAVQEGTEAVERKIQKAMDAGVKVCGIWSQDWCGYRRTGFGYQVMWNWQWDQELYPELDSYICKWKEKGIRFLGYINPFIALEKDLYRIAAEKGYCVKDKDGKDYLVTITTFPAAMVDFTNPAAYEWYKDLIKENMIGLGMGGWMADFGEYLPVDAVLFSGENPEKLHNRWPAIWAKMNREAIEECGKQEKVFFFTRAGHTETIKYSTMMWTGDQHVDWSVDDGLPSVIPATLSLAMSGYGITHSDAGGYTTIMHMRRQEELLKRWEEMNVFSPLLRTHEGNQPVNNVQFDDNEELLKQMAKCSEVHAGLKDYLKACVEEQAQHGIPVMRPLFYHYDEEAAYEDSTEYLLGRDILVAPVLTEGVSGRECYLPQDEWTHFFTGESYRGGNVWVQAPIGQPPVFVRKNSEHYGYLMGIAN